jgi:hypothetical protein
MIEKPMLVRIPIGTSQCQQHQNLMSSTIKRKGKHILSPSTKKARGQVVHNLAVQVHELQEEAVNLEGTDESSFG